MRSPVPVCATLPQNRANAESSVPLDPDQAAGRAGAHTCNIGRRCGVRRRECNERQRRLARAARFACRVSYGRPRAHVRGNRRQNGHSLCRRPRQRGDIAPRQGGSGVHAKVHDAGRPAPRPDVRLRRPARILFRRPPRRRRRPRARLSRRHRRAARTASETRWSRCATASTSGVTRTARFHRRRRTRGSTTGSARPSTSPGSTRRR